MHEARIRRARCARVAADRARCARRWRAPRAGRRSPRPSRRGSARSTARASWPAWNSLVVTWSDAPKSPRTLYSTPPYAVDAVLQRRRRRAGRDRRRAAASRRSPSSTTKRCPIAAATRMITGSTNRAAVARRADPDVRRWSIGTVIGQGARAEVGGPFHHQTWMSGSPSARRPDDRRRYNPRRDRALHPPRDRCRLDRRGPHDRLARRRGRRRRGARRARPKPTSRRSAPPRSPSRRSRSASGSPTTTSRRSSTCSARRRGRRAAGSTTASRPPTCSTPRSRSSSAAPAT